MVNNEINNYATFTLPRDPEVVETYSMRDANIISYIQIYSWNDLSTREEYWNEVLNYIEIVWGSFIYMKWNCKRF